MEASVQATHTARPGFTTRGFERSGSYDRLAARVPPGARVLDLACGDGALLRRLPGIGVDLSDAELALARGLACVRGRAQALPFADATFDVVTCHLAFMLFEEPARVVAELARVLRPGGQFLAVLGGGPVAAPRDDDAFAHFLTLAPPARGAIPDRRTCTERGWAELFAGWQLEPWERHELVLDGALEEVWAFLAASYELPAKPAAIRDELARRLPGPIVRCRAVTWLACARAP